MFIRLCELKLSNLCPLFTFMLKDYSRNFQILMNLKVKKLRGNIGNWNKYGRRCRTGDIDSIRYEEARVGDGSFVDASVGGSGVEENLHEWQLRYRYRSGL